MAMKKFVLISVAGYLGFLSPAFASVGMARDGLEFTFALIIFLLILAGALKGIDYMQKNGKKMILKMLRFIKEKVQQLKDLLVNVNYEGSGISNFNS